MTPLQIKFISFLIDEVDAYEEFKTRLWCERRMGIEQFLEEEEPRHWVQGAFIFPLEDESYWELIDKKWRLELLQIEKQSNNT